MLKVDGEDIEIQGTAKEILEDWAVLTARICEAMTNELQTEVGIMQLLEGSAMYLKRKEDEKDV